MSSKLEIKLRAIAAKRGYGRRKTNDFVYGTLAKLRQKKKL